MAVVLASLVVSQLAAATRSGAQCRSDKDCGSSQVCEDQKCKIKKLGECTNDPQSCAKGYHCVGTGRTKRCNSLMPVGKQCLVDPFWICEEHLICEDKVCKIPERGSCTKNRDQCAEGLACVGTRKVKRCKALMPPGKRCLVDPFWVCERNLVCERKVCKIPKGQSCTDYPEECANGLSCVGNGREKTCQSGGPTPGGVGEKCDANERTPCVGNLVCEDDKCKIPEGGACTRFPRDCASGLKCAGKRRSKRCQKENGKVPLGGRCSNSDQCVDGSKCQLRKCRLNPDEICTENPHHCSLQTVCVGRPDLKKCKHPMKLGERCGADPFWVCAKDLLCKRHKCVSRA